DCERTGKDHARAGSERPAGIEHRACSVEIDPVAEIGVGLGLAADDRGEMKYRVRARRNQTTRRLAVGDVAGDRPQPLVLQQWQRRGRVVEQNKSVALAPPEQLHRDPPPQKTTATGNNDSHRSTSDAVAPGPA